MAYRTLRFQRRGAVGVVLLHRPEKRNALSDAMVEELDACVAAVPESVRALVLHGAGEHFCAGLDLSELSGRSAAQGVAHSRSWHRVFDRIQFGRVPVVAVLHGAVVGGGLELASVAHIRVAEAGTFYALPEGQRGIFVGGGGSVRIARLMGVARMSDLMLTGRLLKADEAERYNLVQYVVPKGEALAKAKELAARICKNAPLSNFAITNSLPRIQDMSYEDGLFVERLASEYTRSPESMERLRAFLDKKAPRLQVPK